ncbi:hypothetical protein HNR46_002967 [Haloferula luteola]|uniref:Uncharacterized protein n=1 Tax=Haloferula luteola TaxID=595692 RepID=A0A840VFX4_9BACT|nr:hypothetical protein [Haloferula luteola]MBB5352719.1 hypothetical protein [Haloferula luteola]
MNPPALEKPVRLDPRSPEFWTGLSCLGPLNLQTRTRSLELIQSADPSDTVFVDSEHAWFPSLGWKIRRDSVVAAHACPLPSLPEHVGIIEIDIDQGHERVGLAPFSRSSTSGTFHQLIGNFGIHELEPTELARWRKSQQAPLEMCPCCQSAAVERRAFPDLHPLCSILAEVALNKLEILIETASPSLSVSQFLRPDQIDTCDGIIARSLLPPSLFRVDPLLLHALWIFPQAVDGERRTVLHAYDPLGQRILAISCPNPDQLATWQGLAKAYYG